MLQKIIKKARRDKYRDNYIHIVYSSCIIYYY